jgi:hypothetical protein
MEVEYRRQKTGDRMKDMNGGNQEIRIEYNLA